jgi:hypothetical protein
MKKLVLLFLYFILLQVYAQAAEQPNYNTFKNEVSLLKNYRFSANDIKSFVYKVLGMIEHKADVKNYSQMFSGKDFYASFTKAVASAKNSFDRRNEDLITDYEEIIITPEEIETDFLTNGTYKATFYLTIQTRNKYNNFMSERFLQTWLLKDGAETPVITDIQTKTSPRYFTNTKKP